jgi:hypothetical protein
MRRSSVPRLTRRLRHARSARFTHGSRHTPRRAIHSYFSAHSWTAIRSCILDTIQFYDSLLDDRHTPELRLDQGLRHTQSPDSLRWFGAFQQVDSLTSHGTIGLEDSLRNHGTLAHNDDSLSPFGTLPTFDSLDLCGTRRGERFAPQLRHNVHSTTRSVDTALRTYDSLLLCGAL